jgi:hypothetical protein
MKERRVEERKPWRKERRVEGGKPWLSSSRGQAALYDAIFFLLLVTAACTMVYVFVGSYGASEDQVIRSAHTMNFMQSIMKAVYFIDAQAVSKVSSEQSGVLEGEKVYPGLDAPKGCNILAKWPATLSVADLLKKDLSDPDPTDVKMDDLFGGAQAPGRLAMRCMMKEIMKPFSYAGYYYLADVVKLKEVDVVLPVPNGFKVTNYDAHNLESRQSFSCEDAKTEAGLSARLLAVSTPFRVMVWDNEGNADERPYALRICIWPRQKT